MQRGMAGYIANYTQHDNATTSLQGNDFLKRGVVSFFQGFFSGQEIMQQTQFDLGYSSHSWVCSSASIHRLSLSTHRKQGGTPIQSVIEFQSRKKSEMLQMNATKSLVLRSKSWAVLKLHYL